MWSDNSILYQVYSLGMCGAPKENDGHLVPRILKILDWLPHLQKLNVDTLYFSPIFESDRHGYDTRDYRKIDCRLGTNDDFSYVCKILKENGFRIILDGVFNHVGRGFWAFQDVLQNKDHSPYKDWFCIDFGRNSCYDDGFYYEGWEGHYELVKLNLSNPKVREHLFSCIRFWVDTFHVDGLRLDVAYCLDLEFLCCLREFCNELKPDFLLIGEILFGDYRRILNSRMLQSCTNYECYKGLYSSFNDLNLFEIAYSLNRQFGEEGGLYRGEHLLCFADNHDVTRVASILKEPSHLPLLYGILFSMPGIPCIYYGSEWGILGKKENGSDDALRPALSSPQWNDLTDLISSLAFLHKHYKSLSQGNYKTIYLTNRQFVFQRRFDEDCIAIAINADTEEHAADMQKAEISCNGELTELLTGNTISCINGKLRLPPLSLQLLKLS